MNHQISLAALYESLPPIIPRKDIYLHLGGLITRGTLANLDSQGKGPKSIKIFRHVAYLREDLIAWLEERHFSLVSLPIVGTCFAFPHGA